MVRGLVEQQQAGPAEEQLGERDAHLPAAGERLGGLPEVGRLEAETAQHGVHLRLDAVAVPVLEGGLDLAVAVERGVVLALGQLVSPSFVSNSPSSACSASSGSNARLVSS